MLRQMGNFLACPFCRELFTRGEHEHCPNCDVPLVPMDQLPPSPEALEEEALRGEAVAPEDRLLKVSDFRRGRGALLLIAAFGLFCFFMPWAELRRPELVVRYWLRLARTRAGCSGAVPWDGSSCCRWFGRGAPSTRCGGSASSVPLSRR